MCKQSLVPSFCSKNKNFEVAVKNYPVAVIKVSYSRAILLNLLILPQTFCPGF